ncbi:MAG TPA: DUF222 domain-containing protein [Microbacterium sp.]|nr:DUF222 domain-containing protein [Microbacterium sp.]
MNRLADTLESVRSTLSAALPAAFQADAVRTMPDDDLLRTMATAAAIMRQLEAVIIEGTSQVQERSDAAARDGRLTTRMGCRSVSELVQRATRASKHTVSAYERAAIGVQQHVAPSSGERLPADYPCLRAAMIDGAIGVDGLTAVMAPLSQLAGAAGRMAHLAADAELAASARGEGVDAAPPACAEDLRAIAQVWAVYLDQDGAEPRQAAAMRKRGLALGAGRDGLVPIRGQLLPEVAAQLQRIFDSLLNPKLDGPRFVDTASPRIGPDDTGSGRGLDGVTRDGAYGTGVGEPGGWARHEDAVLHDRADMRTRTQRQHDALATALTVSARSGELPTIGGAAPTLVVAVRAEDLRSGRGYAQLDGATEPVSIGVARHVGCDGAVQRVISEEAGRIIGIHTLDRVFNHHQRKAITLRDGGCIIPGCRVPASWCEVHHVTDHARGGPTHSDNGVLLCWHHHRTLDANGWSVRMPRGVPEVRGPSWWDPHQRWRPTTASPTRMLDRMVRRQ